jgi:hypothetical protein
MSCSVVHIAVAAIGFNLDVISQTGDKLRSVNKLYSHSYVFHGFVEPLLDRLLLNSVRVSSIK